MFSSKLSLESIPPTKPGGSRVNTNSDLSTILFSMVSSGGRFSKSANFLVITDIFAFVSLIFPRYLITGTIGE